MTTTENTRTRGEALLRQLIADQTNAMCAKNLDGIMWDYAPGAVVFDVKPPLVLDGADALRRTWEACLPYFPANLRPEVRDLTITAGGDVAFARWLFRFTGWEMDHPAAQSWMRATAGYQKVGGRWQIVHEHVSVPYDPHTGRAVFTSEIEAKD
jgi:ketosteroid isomerase-like protein